MTLTEATNYMEKVYLENGWITKEQIKRINRDSFIIAVSFILLAITPAILLFTFTQNSLK